MSKSKLRSRIRQMNRSIGVSERTEEALNIFSTIELDDKFVNSHSIALYLSLPDEVFTHNIVERWYGMGKRIYLPRVKGDLLEFVKYQPDSLAQGTFGIFEPTNDSVVSPFQIELMIVPGVAFCSDGRRLGRGRGYYDKYLSQPDFRGYTIGVGYAHQLVADIPCEPHDVRLSKVITSNIYRCSAPPLLEIIGKVLDRAGVAAVGLGCGVDRLLSMGLTWVLSRLSIEIFRQPDSIEDLVIDTWIEDCSRIASTRNFTISNSDGDRVGVATSQWCIIDMKSRRPVDLMAFEIDYTRHVQSREVEIERTRKISDLCSESVVSTYHIANELDIDFNNHVNTMRYIEMMLSMIDEERRSDLSNLRVDIHFMNESLQGDRLTINQERRSQPCALQFLFDIVRPDGKSSVRALFSYLS